MSLILFVDFSHPYGGRDVAVVDVVGDDCEFVFEGVMAASGVWRNLLSGKQAVPTVACPACGAEVPEFRIHSHLDVCLAALGDAGEEVPVGGGGGGERSHRRGGRGRGRKRKGRDGGGEAGRKRGRREEFEKEGDATVVEEDEEGDERDEYASFYQRWEYSVAGLDELGESRKEVRRLSELQKRELLSCGVLVVERHEVSAMVLQLDRLLGEFETTTEGAVSGAAANLHAPGQDGTLSDQGKAVEGWWEQWITAEWPEGPLPSGFHSGLPPRLESELRAGQDGHTDAQEVGMGRPGGQETAAVCGYHTTAMNSILNFSESGGIIGGKSEVVPRSSEVLNKSGKRGAAEVGMQCESETARGEESIPTELGSHSSPNMKRSTVADSSARRPGPPSSSTVPVRNPAEESGASPGLQACPICNRPFPPDTSNREINEHIDQEEFEGEHVRSQARQQALRLGSKQVSMKSDSAVSTTMGDGPGVVALERELAPLQNSAMTVTPPNTSFNASLTIGAPVSDYDPVLCSPVDVMVSGDPPVMQTTNVVREVELGPGMILGALSLDDFKIIMSLFVIVEDH